MHNEDRGQEALDFLKQILKELQTNNQVNTQLVRQTAQLCQQQAQLISTLASKGAQERDTQYLLAQLTQQMNELSEILTEEDPSANYTPVPYQQQAQPSLGQVIGQHLIEGMGYQGGFRAPPRRGRRRRSG